ncbi:hypothetical protein LZ30DRAFT_706674 [Colletotrichum cereale]|nr:hypothetical protein LZ30DRAFT_706674 [Colletotrichum cereale]
MQQHHCRNVSEQPSFMALNLTYRNDPLSSSLFPLAVCNSSTPCQRGSRMMPYSSCVTTIEVLKTHVKMWLNYSSLCRDRAMQYPGEVGPVDRRKISVSPTPPPTALQPRSFGTDAIPRTCFTTCPVCNSNRADNDYAMHVPSLIAAGQGAT